MKNTLKKIAAVFLAVALAVSAAGCGGNTDGNTAQPSKAGSAASSEKISFPLKDPVTMSMLAAPNSDVNLDNTIAMKKMEELTNVKWKIQSVPTSDLTEKRNLLLASNQYPDVLMKAGLDQGTLDKYGRQGTFIALNDLIEKDAPNLSKLLKDKKEVAQAVTSGDGKIYATPEVDEHSTANCILFINQAWLDKLKLKAPTNVDELYEVLKAFKTEDPNGNGKADEIPLMCTTGTPITQLYPYFGISNYGDLTLVGGKPQYLATTDKFKDFLKYCRKLYKDGLLEKDCFTLALDQQKAAGASGDTLGCFFEAGAFLTVGRDKDEQFPSVMPFEKGIFPTSNGVSIGTFAVTDKCKNPDIAVAWADQWYSEEGGRLAWMGVENETYKINTDGSWDWILGKFKDLGTLRANAAIQGSVVHPSIKPDLWWKNASDKNEAKVNQERKDIVAVGAEPFPTVHYSDADSKTIASLTADINPYVSEYIAKVVTGQQELDASWSEYTATLKNMGLDKLMEIYTKAYEEAAK